jgi:hypothetical protein
MLSRLGFTAEETFACEMYGDARLLVPACVAGDATTLLLDTELHFDMSLHLAYARRRALDVERRAEHWGLAPLAECTVLGHGRPHDRVVVLGAEGVDEREYRNAGQLGALYFDRLVLGVDPAGPAAAASARDAVRASFAGAADRLPLLPDVGDRLPVTRALADVRGGGSRPTLAICTNLTRSALSAEYLTRTRPGWWRRRSIARRARREGTMDVVFALPAGRRVTMEVDVVAGGGFTAGDLPLDGWLGIDFLYRWMFAIDFPRHELVLFDY